MSRARLLLLDGPSLGLAPQIVAQRFETVVAINGQGMIVAFVEQNVRNPQEIGHFADVLENGRVVMEGTRSALMIDSPVKRAFLGL